jgi:hypothetical protein
MYIMAIVAKIIKNCDRNVFVGRPGPVGVSKKLVPDLRLDVWMVY